MTLREEVADRYEAEFERLRKKGLPAEAVYAGAWDAALARAKEAAK